MFVIIFPFQVCAKLFWLWHHGEHVQMFYRRASTSHAQTIALASKHKVHRMAYSNMKWYLHCNGMCDNQPAISLRSHVIVTCSHGTAVQMFCPSTMSHTFFVGCFVGGGVMFPRRHMHALMSIAPGLRHPIRCQIQACSRGSRHVCLTCQEARGGKSGSTFAKGGKKRTRLKVEVLIELLH